MGRWEWLTPGCKELVAGDGGSTAYGYNAAMDALGERLGPVLK